MNKNMQQGKLGGPTMYQDGAVYTGWEKFRMSFMGSSNPKEITGRVVIIALVVLLAVFIVVSILAGEKPESFPYSGQLRDVIGQKVETAARVVGVEPANMTEVEPGVYSVNCGFPLDGVAFDLYFYTDDGMLSGFAYIAEYQADVKEAAKDIYKTLFNMRIGTFLPQGETEVVSVSRRNLQKELEKETPFLLRITEVLNPGSATKSYMEQLENSQDWKGRLGEYVTRKATYYMDNGCSYDPLTQKVQLVYSFKIEPEREVKYD